MRKQTFNTHTYIRMHTFPKSLAHIQTKISGVASLFWGFFGKVASDRNSLYESYCSRTISRAKVQRMRPQPTSPSRDGHGECRDCSQRESLLTAIGARVHQDRAWCVTDSKRLHEVDSTSRHGRKQVKPGKLTTSPALPPLSLLLFASVKSARGLYDAWILKSSFYYVQEPSGNSHAHAG